jgi:hypothetical protein
MMDRDWNPVLLHWRAEGSVIWAIASPDIHRIAGVMASPELAEEAAEAHNKTLTGQYSPE